MGRKFRELPMVFVCLLMFGCFLLDDIHPPSAQAAAGDGWTFVDGNLNAGLNKDTARHATDPVMAVYNNELYVAWTENNASTAQIRVRKYDGSTWSWVDGGGTTGINYSTAENARTPYLIVFSGNLYAIWGETYYGVYLTRVKRYDGSSDWTSIDGSATNGLNKDAVNSSGPSFGICDGYLYAAWVETYSGAGGAYQLHVKRYDSGTTWSFVDGGGYTGLNYDTNRSAQKPKLLAINNTLYVIWTEVNASAKYIIRVKRYDGGATWTTVDGGSGLNYNSGNNVAQANLVIYNSSLYAYWLENYFVRMKSYNGSAWSTADGNAGFKQNSLNYAYPESPPAAIPYGNKLYFTWGEDISYDPWSIQTRASYYYSGAMTFIDGDDWTTGLNYNRLQYAYAQKIVEYNGTLYVAWYESNGSANQVRVRSTPLPAVVTSVTNSGNGTYGTGQNFDLYVTYNKAVNVTETPVIPITLTSGVVNGSYISGSGTTTLAFRHTVAAGNYDNDGIAVGTSISLAGGTIRDTVNSLNADLNLNNVASTTGVLMDGVTPTITSTNPTDNATGVMVNQSLIIYFSENISKGTGNIRIRKSADYSIVETINVTSASVTVSSNSATIDPSITFESGTGYYVTIDAGAFTDAVGNNFAGILTYTVWNFLTVDTTPPSGYSVNIDQEYINNNNKTAMSFTFAGAEVGTTYNYTLTSTGGGGPLTGSGSITSANQQVTGVTTFGLNEGTLTLSVTLTDASLNTGAPATDTVLKDTLMPSGYSVDIDQTYINNANKNNLSFNITGAETGASYSYSVSSSGGGTPVTGGGSTSGPTESVIGVDVTGLGDGTLTVSLTMTDVPGNQGLPVTDTVTKDTAAPTGSIVIKGGAADTNTTSVTLTLSATDGGSGVYQMRFSNDGSSWSTWEAYATTKAWTLASGDGTKTVYVQYRDNFLNGSGNFTDTITLDTVAPTGSIAINSGATHTNTTSVTLTLSATDGGSGIHQMRFSNDGSSWSGWEAYGTSKAWTLTSSDGTTTVYVQYRDNVLNESGNFTNTIILDTVAPTGSVVINSGASTAHGTTVTLTLSASDVTSGVYQMRFSNDDSTWTAWEAYAGSKAWTLTPGDGTKTVYVQYRDNALNASGSYSDTILMSRYDIVDFDGDGKTDIAVYRGSTGTWYVIPSGGGAPYGIGWGISTDIPVPGNYDGDGKTDIAVYRTGTGTWYVIPSSGAAPYGFGWGGDASDKPVPGDYDGDGKADYAVYRDGVWFIYPSGGASAYGVGWGVATDKPVSGDYDGDGKTDYAVYRDGVWFVYPSGGGAPYAVGWGISTDKPVPGDYDGDGKTDCAVYRDDAWFVYPSGGGAPYALGWGTGTDKPVPGDYDGDAKTDTAVYRPSAGVWYVIPSGGASSYGVGWGGDPSDVPVATNPD